jgi:aspartate carbamoyltransferase regulatory subunit
MEKDRLRVRKIKAGTVIDHIPSGRALTVLEILGITQGVDDTVSVLINVPSEKYGQKDIVKVEGRELEEDEISKIALTAPEAKINVIRDFDVVEKRKVDFPEKVKGIIECSNPGCITNSPEPVKPSFDVVSKSPIRLRCNYCRRITEEKELLDQLRR